MVTRLTSHGKDHATCPTVSLPRHSRGYKMSSSLASIWVRPHTVDPIQEGISPRTMWKTMISQEFLQKRSTLGQPRFGDMSSYHPPEERKHQLLQQEACHPIPQRCYVFDTLDLEAESHLSHSLLSSAGKPTGPWLRVAVSLTYAGVGRIQTGFTCKPRSMSMVGIGQAVEASSGIFIGGQLVPPTYQF